ncbi:MAG: hypothetical protein QNK37_24325 [Acidobacteriota bacterium]|nr:hypothetical protein [Acidobacteriota bacterium]
MRETTHRHRHDQPPPSLSARCAYCKRIRGNTGNWYNAGPSPAASEIENTTHSVCPTCYGVAVIAMLEEIREEIGINPKPGRMPF